MERSKMTKKERKEDREYDNLDTRRRISNNIGLLKGDVNRIVAEEQQKIEANRTTKAKTPTIGTQVIQSKKTTI